MAQKTQIIRPRDRIDSREMNDHENDEVDRAYEIARAEEEARADVRAEERSRRDKGRAVFCFTVAAALLLWWWIVK